MEIDRKYNKLVKWIRNNGGYINEKLIIKNVNNDRTIYTNDILSIDEKIIDIPDIICININQANELPFNTSGLNENTLFYIIVLYHYSIKQKSFYYPYFNMIPNIDAYKTHPLYLYNEEKIKIWETINKKTSIYIQNHINNLNKIKGDILQFNKQYNIFNQDILTDEMFKYIYIMIYSRKWNNVGLVPYADLIQHSNNSSTVLKNDNNINSFVVKEQYDKDSEIYVSYGMFDEFATYAGFGFIDRIEKINDINRYLRLNLMEEYNNNSFLVDIIKQSEIKQYNSIPRIYYLTNQGIQSNLLDYLKILAKDKDDIKRTLDGLDTSLNNYSQAYQLLFKIITTENILVKTSEIDILKENLSKFEKNSVEWNLSYLSIVMFNIVMTTLNNIYVGWINNLNSPFNIELKINI